LILGAAGFVGRWVARRLASAGAELHLAVRTLAPAQAVFARYGIAGQVHVVDLRQADAVRQLVWHIRPAITFNMAGYGVDPTERDETEAYGVNLSVVETVAEAVAAVRQAAWPGLDLVHVGSALEYGAARGDLAEESLPEPGTLYGDSKLAGTLALAERCAKGDLAAATARLFTVYGPGEHPSRLLPSLIDAARTGAPLPLTAGGQLRDFTYVDDVAEGLLRLGLVGAERLYDGGWPAGVVNLATGRLTAVREFAEQAAAVMGIRADQLVFGARPTRAEEMHHAPVSLRRLRRWLDWAPPTPVAAGITQTWMFERDQEPFAMAGA
jgi:nucleoside-diphosphate-sugar epimerase